LPCSAEVFVYLSIPCHPVQLCVLVVCLVFRISSTTILSTFKAVMIINNCLHWRRGKGGSGGQLPAPFSPQKKFFGLSENLLVQKFSSENANIGAETSILEKVKGKIEISSTDNFLCRKFAAVCWKFVGNFQLSVGKLQLPVPPTFLTHNTADCLQTVRLHLLLAVILYCCIWVTCHLCMIFLSDVCDVMSHYLSLSLCLSLFSTLSLVCTCCE